MTDKIYNHTEMTDITQYNVEDVYKDGSATEKAFGNPKRYVPVFHGLQPKPEGVTQLHEGYVEIGGPTDTPWDTEDFDDEILAQSGLERPIHPDSISVSPTTLTVKLANPLDAASARTITAIVTPTSSEFPVTWSSGNTNKATVDGGVITPVAEGEDISITATSGAVSASALIKVEKVGVTSVAIKKDGEAITELTLTEGDTANLIAAISPSNAYVKDVTWSSSDETVATVEDGVVTAVAAGDPVTITATSTDNTSKKATCTVTVQAPATEPEEPEEPGE